jgi:hypothetical protein
MKASSFISMDIVPLSSLIIFFLRIILAFYNISHYWSRSASPRVLLWIGLVNERDLIIFRLSIRGLDNFHASSLEPSNTLLVFVFLSKTSCFCLKFRIDDLFPILLILSFDLSWGHSWSGSHVVTVWIWACCLFHFGEVALADWNLCTVLEVVWVLKTWLWRRYIVYVGLKVTLSLFWGFNFRLLPDTQIFSIQHRCWISWIFILAF